MIFSSAISNIVKRATNNQKVVFTEPVLIRVTPAHSWHKILNNPRLTATSDTIHPACEAMYPAE